VRRRELSDYQNQNLAPKLDYPIRFSQPPQSRWDSWKLLLYGMVLFLGSFFLFRALSMESLPEEELVKEDSLSLPILADYGSPFSHYPFPDTLQLNGDKLVLDYHPDTSLQNKIERFLRRHRPEVAVVAVCDLYTGHLISHQERRSSAISAKPDLLFGKNFPAASLFKIVTAAAALANGIALSDSLVQRGAYHTLYKWQLREEEGIPLPKVTMKKAFANSMNPAFGILGIKLGSNSLSDFSALFGFNRRDLPVQLAPSLAPIPEGGYSLAEVSCGFTDVLTLSPLHALEIVRMIGAHGTHLPVFFTDSALHCGRSQKIAIPQFSLEEHIRKLPRKLQMDLQEMMEYTVSRGTARKPIRKMLKKHHLDKLIMGGKTGSLDGEEPRGRYDWYAGYVKLASDPSRGVAVVVMLVHQTYRSLRAASLAGLVIREWLREAVRETST